MAQAYSLDLRERVVAPVASLEISVSMVYRVRKQWVDEGLEARVEPQGVGRAGRASDFRR
jgi:hypothetical protein